MQAMPAAPLAVRHIDTPELYGGSSYSKCPGPRVHQLFSSFFEITIAMDPANSLVEDLENDDFRKPTQRKPLRQ
jgi:hypothetical protein